MTTDATERQAQIYLRGLMGGGQVPITMEDWRALAEEVLPAGPFAYFYGGAGAEETLRANRNAFLKFRIVPHTLRDIADRDLRTSLFGRTHSTPLALAPIGALGIVREDADLIAGRAAAAAGIPFILSTVSSASIETVADAMGDGERWFQLYPLRNRELMASLVRRVEAAGYSAIVVTVDAPLLGWRERDLRLGYLPFAQGQGMANFLSDPVFATGKPTMQGVSMETVMSFLALLANVTIDSEVLRWIRGQTSLPLLVKGILRGDDARRALDAGADGVIVSNHGGRQVDGAIAAIDAVAGVRDSLWPDVPVLMDSGIRSGADMLKALALGANMVLLGRPYVYALAARGEEGVGTLIANLIASFDAELALSGLRTIGDVDRSLLALPAP